MYKTTIVDRNDLVNHAESIGFSRVIAEENIKELELGLFMSDMTHLDIYQQAMDKYNCASSLFSNSDLVDIIERFLIDNKLEFFTFVLS